MSTHNRPEVRALTIPHWLKKLPPRASFMLVDDASDVPADGATFRFEENVGISRTKNKSIELAYDSGAEHIFLVDDDIYPLSKSSCHPYVTSGVLHLCHSWGRRRLEATDAKFTYWTYGRGVMLYIHRSVIDKVGGMRTEYPNLEEHLEYSRRIYSAGLTPHPFMDVKQGSELWWCSDYTRKFPSTSSLNPKTPEESAAIKSWCGKLSKQFKGSSDFVQFREN